MTTDDTVQPIRTVTSAAMTGTRRDLLVALLDKLWVAFHDGRTQPRDLSPLTLRIKELKAEIAAIDDAEQDERDVAIDEVFDPDSV